MHLKRNKQSTTFGVTCALQNGNKNEIEKAQFYYVSESKKKINYSQ